MSSHGRAAMAMAMAIRGRELLFWRAIPNAMRYQSAGDQPAPLTLHFCPGGTSPPPSHAHVWPWPGRHGHGHEFGHVLPRMAMAMAIRGRELLFWRAIPTRYEISICWRTSPPLTLHFWPGGPVPPPTPTCGHGRAAMAMAMSLATFYRASPWPWPWPWPRFTEALH